MHDEPLPRKLKERTGKHVCVRCLAEIPADTSMLVDIVDGLATRTS